MKEHYRVLGVSENATEQEIKTAYKKLAVQYHPDKGGDVEKFKKINNAYDILGNSEKKRQYDQEDIFMNARPASAGGNANFHPFASFFGGGFNPFFHQEMRGPDPSRHSQTSSKTSHKMDISLENAYKGIDKKIAITMTDKCPKCKTKCPKCQGNGKTVQNHIQTVNNRQFVRTITVPCNKCTGKGFMTNQGEECEMCSSSGRIEQTHTVVIGIPPRTFQDFTKTFKKNEHTIEINVHIVFPPKFERHGNDLVYRHEIKLLDALLGSPIFIPHPSSETIEINNTDSKHTINPGTVLTFRNRGVLPNTHMKVHFDIQFPCLKPFSDNDKREQTYSKINEVFTEYFNV